jgi:hypothetical protein
MMTGSGIHAFTLGYLGISSRLIFHETSLLFLEVKLALECYGVGLIKATLSSGLIGYIL